MSKLSRLLGPGLLAVSLTACSPEPPPPSPGPAPETPTGGTSGSGGAKAPDSGSENTGGSAGGAAGGQSGSGGGGSSGNPADAGTSGPAVDAGGSPPGDRTDAGGGSTGNPSTPDQGPRAEGKIVFSQDFENGMEGVSRSPASLPADRLQITDDPLKQRGKVMRIEYRAGDNFRTSPGTEPRSWMSTASGYAIKPGSTVSISFGFMTDNPSWDAYFAQIIRDGGPLWMLRLTANGTIDTVMNAGSGGVRGAGKIEPMKWHDFRVDTQYMGGGNVTIYLNGQMLGQGKSGGGGPGRFDGGIYWYHGSKQTRNVWFSNISIGEK